MQDKLFASLPLGKEVLDRTPQEVMSGTIHDWLGLEA